MLTDEITGYASGTSVFPSIRTVDAGVVLCRTDFPRFIIPYPLDDLDITISTTIINCDELRVNVQGSEGTAPYEYAYSDNPANFNATATTWRAGSSTTIDGNPVAAGEGAYEWINLTPGRTYVFYVRDANNCIRQSSVNVNDLRVNPMEITPEFEPSCAGANDGEITYTIVDTDGAIEPNMRWELFTVDGTAIIDSGGSVPYSATITVTNLVANEYYIIVTQLDASNIPSCVSGSENILIAELDPIAATVTKISDIGCSTAGIIQITNITGGGTQFNYTVTGPSGFSTITGTSDNPIEIAANSPAGNYNITISDEFGCTQNLGVITMSLTPNPTIDSITINNCDTLATITVAATGTAPMRYSIDGGTTYESNNGIFTNVTAGTYTLFIKDGNGCTASQNSTVHPTLSATAVLTKLLDCSSNTAAQGSITIANGSSNYEYELADSAGAVTTRTAVPATSFVIDLPTVETYTITIFDIGTTTPECSTTLNLNVVAAILPSFTAQETNVSCNGGTDGSIQITQTDTGINPLSYVLSPNTATINPNTQTFENLPAGTYSVAATGTNDCVTSITGIVIDQPAAIAFTAPTVTQFGCSNGNIRSNATIEVATTSITGGSASYPIIAFSNATTNTILQTGSNASYVITDTTGGDYTITVYDSNGCSANASATIDAFDELTNFTVQVTEPISCSNAGEDITLQVSGTTTSSTTDAANYEYRLLPNTAFATTSVFTDLAIGNYSFEARNVTTGCIAGVSHTVRNPDSFTIVLNKLSDVVCFGDNGEITVEITDNTYTAGFNWTIFNTNGTPDDRTDDGVAVSNGTSADLGPTATIPVPQGSFLMEVSQTGLPNCTKTRAFTISGPEEAIQVNLTEEQNVSCANNKGAILVTPQGGIPPYALELRNTTTTDSYTKNNITSSFIFTDLNRGVFDITITDALGCVSVFTNELTLLSPDAIAATTATTTLACAGDTTATLSVTIAARNISPNYTFSLIRYTDDIGSNLISTSAAQASAVFNNLGTGFYSVRILDDVGCSFNTAILEIGDPTEVTSFLSTARTLGCTANAELLLMGTGGTPPFMWSTDGSTFNAMNEIDGTDTHTFTNIGVGTYRYFLQDSNACISVQSNEITVNAIVPLSLSWDSNLLAVSCNGEATGTIAAEAQGGLSGYEYSLFSDAGYSAPVVAPRADGIFRNLFAGTYYLRVTSADCIVDSGAIISTEPSAIQVTGVATPVSCADSEDGIITIEATGGTGIYKYAISPDLDKFDVLNVFEELAPASYTIIAQDAKGCFELLELTVTAPTPLAVSLSATPEFCVGEANGTITINPSGGTAPYSTSFNANSAGDYTQDKLEYTNIPGGDHFIFIKDANGCETNESITVTEGVNINATVTVLYECNATTLSNRLEVELTDRTERLYVLYGLDSTDPADYRLQPDFENISPGNHTLTIAHDNGCVKTIPFEVASFDPLTLSLEQRGINEITAIATGGNEAYRFIFDGISTGDKSIYNIRRTDTYQVSVIDTNGCEATAEIFIEFIDIEIANFFTPDGDGFNDLWLPQNMTHFPNLFLKVYDRYGRFVYNYEDNKDGWDGIYNDTTLPTGDYWYVIKLNGESDDREFVGHFTLYR